MPHAHICVDCHALTHHPKDHRCPRCYTKHQLWRNQQPNRRRHMGALHRHIRDTTIETQGHCQHCGTTRDLTCDYITPINKGGLMTLENAQCLCRSCNSRKGDQ